MLAPAAMSVRAISTWLQFHGKQQRGAPFRILSVEWSFVANQLYDAIKVACCSRLNKFTFGKASLLCLYDWSREDGKKAAGCQKLYQNGSYRRTLLDTGGSVVDAARRTGISAISPHIHSRYTGFRQRLLTDRARLRRGVDHSPG